MEPFFEAGKYQGLTTWDFISMFAMILTAFVMPPIFYRAYNELGTQIGVFSKTYCDLQVELEDPSSKVSGWVR